MSEVKNVTITVPVGLNGWQQEGSVVINGMKVEFPVGVETEVPETAAALLKELIEAAEKRAENVPANNSYKGSLTVPAGHILHLEKGAKIKDENGILSSGPEDVVILPVTALVKMEENDVPIFMLLTQPAAPLLNGNIYDVGYNGTVYECTAIDMGLMEDGVANGQLLLGNLSGLGIPSNYPGSNDSAPFAVILSSTPVIDGDIGVGYGMCYPFDGATAVNLSVTWKPGETGDAGYADKTVILTLDPLNGVSPTIDMVWSLVTSGKQVILHTVNPDGSGSFLPLVEYLYNGGDRYVYFVGIDHEDTLFRWTLGPDGFGMYTKKL